MFEILLENTRIERYKQLLISYSGFQSIEYDEQQHNYVYFKQTNI